MRWCIMDSFLKRVFGLRYHCIKNECITCGGVTLFLILVLTN
jgi:hypothetical protein